MSEATESAQVVVSLDLELFTLGYAARGAQVLADLQARGGLMDSETERDAPMCISAMLALLETRMRHLRRVLRGEEDPGHLLAHHNTVSTQGLPEAGEEAYLFAWGREQATGDEQVPASRRRRRQRAERPCPQSAPVPAGTPSDQPPSELV
jgi:hypothetical protein